MKVSKRTNLKQKLVRFEERIRKLWEKGKIKCPIHLSGGNEYALIDIFKDVRKGDYVLSTHRNHYHYLLHGGNPRTLLREILRKEDALCRGRSGSMCTTDHSLRFYSSAIVGGICAIAVGLGYSLRAQGSTNRVWAFVGDGCVDTGHFLESLRYVEGHNLPVTFIIEDNDRSTCTTVSDRWGKRYGIVFGNLRCSPHVKYYEYKPKYPHVGSGKYIAF